MSLVFLVFAPDSASAQSQNASRSVMATMNGKCHKLTFAGTDASRICDNSLVNFAYASGKSSFQFIAKDKAIVGFFGTDSKAVGNKATMLVENITLNLMMGTPSTSTAATGTCSYTNPYAGPSLIQCSAETDLGLFEATFVSDGREPNLKEF